MEKPKAVFRTGPQPPSHACRRCGYGSVAIACALCGSELPEEHPDEAWLEVVLEGGWIAAYRLIPQGGQPVVGEVRIFPEERSPRSAGRWSAERLGNQAPVPFGGIPARVLRQLRVREHLALLDEIVQSHQARQSFRLNLLDHGFEQVAREAGRRGRSDHFYAEIASAYVALIGERDPIPRLRKRLDKEGLHFADATIRDFVNRARDRGLLTRSPKGRPGGELTPKALELLRSTATERGAHEKSRTRVKIRNPGDGSVGESTQLAFEKAWKPKGWTLVDDEHNNEGEQP